MLLETQRHKDANPDTITDTETHTYTDTDDNKHINTY